MNTFLSVLGFVRNHFEAACVVIIALIIMLAIWGANQSGRHAQATIDATIAQQVRDSTNAARRAELVHSLDMLRDSATAMVRIQAKLDSAKDAARAESATRVTAANLIRSRTSIDSATATVTIKTDTGAVTLAVPPLVATTWSNERTADLSALDGMKRSLHADSLSIAERDLRIHNDSLQSVQRDSIDVSNESQIKSDADQIAKLERQKTPRITATGVLVGALGALAGVVTLALVF